MLGVRDERILNRDDDGGEQRWRMGLNLWMLVNPKGPAWIPATPEATPNPGDLLCMTYTDAARRTHGWDGTHICVVESYADLTLKSFDYGQIDPVHRLPAAKRVARRVSLPWKLGERVVMGWVDIARLQLQESALVPNDFEGAMPDDNPYPDQVQLKWAALDTAKARTEAERQSPSTWITYPQGHQG